ncbi:hemerythrin domain-containing protein [Nocardioides silvaticus]|uniref:Hemerythrin domain-containing protein n=1 Tax=Nocardioides silvaticus TaxID=2201891 RepID=A0A316TFN0_9ACTN|nr:hemerythrin domain-containing protein [Nocardioides silvaticus]PWN03287.1 hemerythrin domain-containing protein [Nocardioides silvaticus]
MTNTKTDHPEQLKLPGQAAAPGGPVDMKVMYLMHHAFRRDLRKFAEAVPRTPVDDRATWVALAERWERFSEILHHHHSGEDAGIWPFLLERADESERETLLAMEAEHEKIDPLLQRASDGFAQLAAGADRPRDELRAALAVRLAEAQQLLGDHLRHEETEAIVIIQRYLTPEDWERIDEEYFKPGVSIGFLLYAVPWMAEELPRPVLDEVLAEAGLPMRVMKGLGSRLKFRRLESKAFKYAA